jgi:rhodanese-related sulfurtransferase
MSLLSYVREYVKNTKEDWNYITPVDFYQTYFSKRRRDFVVIDLRKKEDYQTFHMPRSVNMFWLDLLSDKNLKRLEKYVKNGKKLFLICYVGHTSSQAMTLLKLLGIPVTSIKFGYGLSPVENVPVAGWLQYHYPITISNKI